MATQEEINKSFGDDRRDEAIKVVFERFVREFGWQDSPEDQRSALEQAEWAIESLEARGLLRV